LARKESGQLFILQPFDEPHADAAEVRGLEVSPSADPLTRRAGICPNSADHARPPPSELRYCPVSCADVPAVSGTYGSLADLFLA